MGRQIIKQPNGNYAVWSSIVTDFIILDATKDELIDMLIEDEKEKITREVDGVIEKLKQDKKPYYQFTKTWDEALAQRDELHGKESRDFSENDFMPKVEKE